MWSLNHRKLQPPHIAAHGIRNTILLLASNCSLMPPIQHATQLPYVRARTTREHCVASILVVGCGLAQWSRTFSRRLQKPTLDSRDFDFPPKPSYTVQRNSTTRQNLRCSSLPPNMLAMEPLHHQGLVARKQHSVCILSHDGRQIHMQQSIKIERTMLSGQRA